MTGPSLTVVHDDRWIDHLAEANVSSFYHTPKKGLDILAPGAYSSPDSDVGPSDGDRIVVRQSEWNAAVRYGRSLMGDKSPPRADADGFKVVLHEFLHTCVPAPPATGSEGNVIVVLGRQSTYALSQRRYSHPDKAIAACIHSISTGFACNAFTRLLRWRIAPPEAMEEFLPWLDLKATELETSA
jgi:hypothetical protein